MDINKNYGLNDYNMQILPYRISGSGEYTNRDIINLSQIKELKEIFNKNGIISTTTETETEKEQYGIVNNKLHITPPKIATYITATLREIETECGKIHFYLNIYEFNDNRFGAEMHVKNSTTYICEDFDGLLKYLNDIGILIE